MRWSWSLVPVALSSLCAAAVLATIAVPLLVPLLAIGPVLPLLALGAVDVLPPLVMIEHRIPSAPKGLWEAGVVAGIGLVPGTSSAGGRSSRGGLTCWRPGLASALGKLSQTRPSTTSPSLGVLASPGIGPETGGPPRTRLDALRDLRDRLDDDSRVDETPGNASWPERTGEN
jgi:hypothetical protein